MVREFRCLLVAGRLMVRVIDLERLPTPAQINRLSRYLANVHDGGPPGRYRPLAQALLRKFPIGEIVDHSDFFDPYFTTN